IEDGLSENDWKGWRGLTERLGQRPDLVQFDENGISGLFLNSLLQGLFIGDEEVVSDQLYAAAEPLGQPPPSLPVVFGKAVFDRDDRKLVDQGGVVVDHLFGREALSLRLQRVFALLIKLARRRVERQQDVAPGPVAGLFDPLDDQLQRLSVRLHRRREAPFISY